MYDHLCGDVEIACIEWQVMKENKEEVWMIEFSLDGQVLVSVAKDSRIHVYFYQADFKYQLAFTQQQAHSKPLQSISWLQSTTHYSFVTTSLD